MRKQQIQFAAHEVATQVRMVEDSIEIALAEIAELQARMIRARQTAGVGVATGHSALEQLCSATQALVAARGGMVHCHAALRESTKSVPGLRETGMGEVQECPPPSAQLRVVA